MKIYDITQELLGCRVYPGDPKPERRMLSNMKRGDLINLSQLKMCLHNGTHVDAPKHFLDAGKAIDEIDLEAFVGRAYVAECQGELTAGDASRVLERASDALGEPVGRLLIKGNAVVSQEAAEVFAAAGLQLLGNESQTVGPQDAPMRVHVTLLSAQVVLLEGVELSCVPEGSYFLNAAPLNIAGADGAPCRAILVEGIGF